MFPARAQSMSARSETLLILSIGRMVKESISRPTVLDRIGLLNARICASLKRQRHDKDILLKGFMSKVLLFVRVLVIFKLLFCLVAEKVIFSGCLLL